MMTNREAQWSIDMTTQARWPAHNAHKYRGTKLKVRFSRDTSEVPRFSDRQLVASNAAQREWRDACAKIRSKLLAVNLDTDFTIEMTRL